MLTAAIACFYVALFVVLILMARAQQRTVWAVMAESFRNLNREMGRTLAALGLVAKPMPTHGGKLPGPTEDRRISAAKAAYVDGTIEADEMEQRISDVLDGSTDKPVPSDDVS